MRAAFYTLGCKVNQYETEILMQRFGAAGFDIVSHRDPADVFVINSCTVTGTSDQKTRQVLRRLRRENPGAVLALTGCFPQAFPKDAQSLKEADVITGARNRGELLDAVQEFLVTRRQVVRIIPHDAGEPFEPMRANHFLERTRAFIKIEDGCDRYCSYCIIPTARGPIRSKPLEDLQAELADLVTAGYQEFVLAGINLSSYGREWGLRLVHAVQAACQVPGVMRVRLGSLEPELLTREDIRRMAALPQFCPQFHLSLQSGCDATLRRMNRHYNGEEYLQIVQDIRAVFPDASITTDVMVGFPGETDEEFAESLRFVEKLGLAKAHVFAYSRRPGTRADRMENQVSRSVKEARSAKMIALTDESRRRFLLQQVPSVQEVLFESAVSEHIYEGYTKNYTPVRLASAENLQGQLKKVRLNAVEADFCIGILEE